MYAVESQRAVIPSGGRAFDKWVNLGGVHLDYRSRLKELEMPVLLLWGDRDRLIPYATALQAVRQITPDASSPSPTSDTAHSRRSPTYSHVCSSAGWMDMARRHGFEKGFPPQLASEHAAEVVGDLVVGEGVGCVADC